MQTLTVGLVADPGLSTTIVDSLAAELPRKFAEQISDRIHWKVETHTRALPLDEQGNVEVWEHSDRLMRQQGWDLFVSVTELTRRWGETLVASDTNKTYRAAVISLPALGPIRLRHHVTKSIVRVVHVLFDSEGSNTYRPGRSRPSPLHPTREEVADDSSGRNVVVELSPVRGRLRLVLGMVRVNRPWRLLPSLSSAIAAAVAAAAFGVFYSSIWNMADSMSGTRLAIISVVAIMSMMLWLMLYNGLWERPRDLDQRSNAALYNTATVLTLAAGVTSMYVLLFTVVLLGSLIIVPPDYLESVLAHPASWRDYTELALLASSLGTFAGALGSSFESDRAVRSAMYGKREQERHARTTR
ncbi:hypothetical protein [[Mycobacterium] burgundiense]|uniref:5,10-methylene-tetrahydrofolate dehydrogenase n=1 Tax=[Mycobacterium] burgundiense TaxID=3064286 RepID=A0ABM9LWV9_9MYCO|nr:hypothetical protein [Mycolicibacterium sp. MU0053]CAJ1506048.1 hypothetical protein MU0053_003092 [Mycolicibacterium sp. MU0053]